MLVGRRNAGGKETGSGFLNEYGCTEYSSDLWDLLRLQMINDIRDNPTTQTPTVLPTITPTDAVLVVPLAPLGSVGSAVALVGFPGNCAEAESVVFGGLFKSRSYDPALSIEYVLHG